MIRKSGENSGPRLFIIGLDGASFNHLEPIIKSGETPNIARLFESGAKSGCLSVVPPLTPPAWTTMMTGVNPGKHGIFDFIQPDESGLFRMVDASVRKRRTFIMHAEDCGVKTVSILVPYTFPADPSISGLMISGLGTPSKESDFIRPHSLRDYILANFPHVGEIDPTKGRALGNLHFHLRDHTRKTVELTRWAINEIPDAGLFFTVFQATDFIPHFYSRYFDPSHHEFNPDDTTIPLEYRNALKNIYIEIDILIGELLETISAQGGHIILVSDHGSEPLAGTIGKDAFLIKWLEKNGYLKLKSSHGKSAQKYAGSIANRLLYLAKRYTPHAVRNAVNQIMGKKKNEIISNLTAIPFFENIDWDQTHAFCAPGGYGVGIYINRNGDFPYGIVQKGADYFRVLDEIKQKLLALEIAPGIPLFNAVLSKSEAVWGNAIHPAPDLFLLWREDPILKEMNYTLTDGSALDPPGQKSGTKLVWCGTHRMEGMFGIIGDGVKSNITLTQIPNLADIMPTIHMIAGIPVPSDIDGTPILSAFDDDFIASHPIIKNTSDDFGQSTQAGMSSDDSEKLLDLLTGLGYLN